MTTIAARDVPGRSRREQSQSSPKILSRSAAQGGQTAQGRHHSSRKKTCHNRKRVMQGT